MAAADQLIALVTKTADKLNALNTAIGTKANIGVSTEAGNNLSVGSDSKPYFNASNLPLGVSSDADNALILGTDSKPYLENDLFVPSTRILSAGIGINTIGDLSANRPITLDFDYLDTRYSSEFKQREAVRVATTGNITLSGLQTIDGVVLVAGDRVLVRKQTNAAQNGVYIASSTAWTRAIDFDEPDIEEVTQGASVYVEDGTLLKGTGWTLQTPPPYVIGTTELEFIQYASVSSYTGGNLITIDGNQINHDTGSWAAKSNLSGATVISNLSVDAYGHLTNWNTRNLTAGNIGAEPAFSKNSAFNKNFGTTSGTVMEGASIYTQSESDNRFLHSTLNDIKTNGYTRFIPAVQWGENAEVNTNYMSGDNQWRLDFPTNAFVRWRNSGSGDAFTMDISNGNFYASGTGTFGGDVEVPNNSWYMGGSTRLLRSTNSGWVNIGDTPPTITLYAQNEVRLKNFTPITDNSGYQYMNMTSGGFLRIGYGNPGAVTIFGGSSPRYNNGTNNYDLYHAGNLRSDSQNDSRYLQLTGGTLSGNITASNLSGTNTGDQTWSTLGGKPTTFTPSAHTHPASDITSGTFANARISESSVTQHEAAINAGSVDGKHIWTGSQASYDAIGTKDSNTIYFIT